MNEQQALERMVPPSQFRPNKVGNLGGVIQIHVTRSCDKACYGCTQGSNLRGKVTFITLEQFENALRSLDGYFGVVGVFGGNPAIHPQFEELCALMRQYIPINRSGIWCNNPLGKGHIMRKTFDPRVSNLNVHLDHDAYKEFKDTWPDSMPFGQARDSRHSPPYVALKDVVTKPCSYESHLGERCHQGKLYKPILQPCPQCDGTGRVYDEDKGWDLISQCDINQHWSAMIGVFRGELRAWFCEVAGAQSILHQDDPEYPDTGHRIGNELYNALLDHYNVQHWWQLPMRAFTGQVRKHCRECGIPLRGYGELAQTDNPDAREQVSNTHRDIYKPKRANRNVELVTHMVQLGIGRIERATDYMGNARK